MLLSVYTKTYLITLRPISKKKWYSLSIMENRQTETGITKCEWCLTEVPYGTNECPVCTGPITLLHPAYVQCGWCGKSNRRDLSSHCEACKGELPIIPGGHGGPKPPATPRHIPSSYVLRLHLFKNVAVIIGVIFTVVFFWTILFPIVGIFLWIYGYKQARNRLAALRQGEPTVGTITAVYEDTTKHINNRHPIAIKYTYETPEGSFDGKAEAWDRGHLDRPVGEQIWVVHNPTDPQVHAIWPPLK